VPTYQYRCTQCEESLEVVQKFSDDPLTECPVCHGRLRKLFSPVGVVFKGSGFYKTDSRARTPASTARPDDAAKPAADGATSGDSAPAAAKPAPAPEPAKSASGDTKTSGGGKTDSGGSVHKVA
jgi:putative FmdB family regulatory protein